MGVRRQRKAVLGEAEKGTCFPADVLQLSIAKEKVSTTRPGPVNSEFLQF